MAYIRTSTNTFRQTATTSASTPELVLAVSNPQAIGRADDLREQAEEQPVAIPRRDQMIPAQELRKATRYQFNSAAVIRWLGADEQIHQAFGIVRNISVSGVYIESTAPISMYANVELEIAAPNLQSISSGPDLNFEGRVVRAVEQGRKKGFAIAGALYVSREPKPW